MRDSTNCHIRNADGVWEIITYGELIERAKTDAAFAKKHFISVQGELIEATESQCQEYNRDMERQRYLRKNGRRKVVSFDTGMPDGSSMQEIVPDPNACFDSCIDRADMAQKLQECLLTLSDSEAALIHALFFDSVTETEYAKKVGVSQSTVGRNKKRILCKMLKILRS